MTGGGWAGVGGVVGNGKVVWGSALGVVGLFGVWAWQVCYVCVSVYVCQCMCVLVCVSLYVCLCLCVLVCVFVYVCSCVCVLVCVFWNVCLCLCVLMCVLVYVCLYVCVCMYVLICDLTDMPVSQRLQASELFDNYAQVCIRISLF